MSARPATRAVLRRRRFIVSLPVTCNRGREPKRVAPQRGDARERTGRTTLSPAPCYLCRCRGHVRGTDTRGNVRAAGPISPLPALWRVAPPRPEGVFGETTCPPSGARGGE